MAKKYWLETYGCQMNDAESAALENSLERNGWEAAETEKDADLVILNTCSVRETAETRIWGRLGYFKSLKKETPFRVAVMGCMAERLKEKIKEREPSVDIVVGNFARQEFITLLNTLDENTEEFELTDSKFFKFSDYHGRNDQFNASVPIMHGCNNFCTYCIVPHVRGREVSRDCSGIINEIQKMAESGVCEVMLLGQNVNSYQFDYEGRKIGFPELLQMICDKTDIKWIRFMSSHPKDFSDDLIQVIKNNPQICRHIHLPVQHGSDKILEAMNRKYTVEQYLKIIDKLKNELGDVSLTTDILVGFPGETQQDFDDTLELVKKVRYDDAFTYHYNKREGTPAASYENQVDDDVKKERLAILIKVQREIAQEIKTSRIGQTVEILVEKVSKRNDKEMLGRSDKNSMVVFEGNQDLIGQFVTVKLQKLQGSTYKGVLECPGK